MNVTEETLRDVWGDVIEVQTEREVGNVYVVFSHRDMSLTPKKARKFAKMLKRAAKRAEGQQ